MTAIVCIWFPQWSLQHIFQTRPELKDQPVILHSPLSGRGPHVIDGSAAAKRCGVRPGMPVAEARALVERFAAGSSASRRSPAKSRPSSGSFFEYDPAADRAALRRLAHRCETYTPLYGVEEEDEPECLLLDVSGSAALFGGPQALAEKIQEDFHAEAWRVRVAIAPTIGAAWAVAHGVSRDNQAVVVPQEGLAETLDSLPLRWLRLPPAMVQTLSELGIHGIGQLRRLPRERLPARFGSRVLQRLDQAFGQARELIAIEHPHEPIGATWAAQEPFRDRLVLVEVCRRLLEKMLQALAGKRHGVRRLRCQFHGCGSRPCEFTVGLVSPTQSADRLQELLELQLERMAWDDEITFVKLEVTEVSLLEERPRDLLGDPLDDDHARELQWLLERLSSRLGAEAVVRAAYVPDPQPELSVSYEPWIESAAAKPSRKSSGQVQVQEQRQVEERLETLVRPPRLLAMPQRIDVSLAEPSGVPRRFFWNGADHPICQAWGPERIETGWWRGCPVRRDYYRVEVMTGERYWIFRTEDGWFLQGIW